MKQGIILWVNPRDLKENAVSSKFYSIPENYEMMKENIKKVGILEPIIVIDNVVESGNLRLRIAKDLELEKVPVIFQPKSKLCSKLRVVSHGQQRIKKYSEILAEYEVLEAEYPVGKGCRTDLDPSKKSNAEKKKALNISKTKLTLLKSIKTLGEELYDVKSKEYNDLWIGIDTEKASLNRIMKSLKREKAIRENQFVIPDSYDFITDHAKIYNKSCEDMKEIANESISCILTSPPYFQMCDYGTGKLQRGLEKEVEIYIQNLVSDFKDCKRVLKSDGSLWVNINEPVINGEYHLISYQFVKAMRNEGWIFNDEIIWIKNNPNFTQAKRSVRSHEYIFHFVKSNKYQYDISWLSELSDPDNLISLGTSGKVSNLISGMDFRGSILRTNSNNMDSLRKECKKQGFHLTHNAAFPITIPLIAILTSSKVGDTILDIYSGTSTTGEAALATKRRYIGYEIKPEFVMASKVRLENHITNELCVAA